MQNNIWQLQDAKSHFSEVINKAINHVPQIVTKRGKEVVVICSVDDFKDKTITSKDLFNFFRQRPYVDDDMLFERQKDLPRNIDLT